MADITFTCGLCPKKHTAPQGSTLALLQLCEECARARYAKGKKEQRKAMAATAANATGDKNG